ncbi:DUF481 domain-containing protein [Synechococcus sp. MIT S9508]|uniref:DUF481 domain-containing protein n=1 Tax=Synechococcus sp. MIT S9508 TaxID=1801629 RepID=UPI0007BC25F8|nr:DUF481 domain-containing protein [Synechococcus sp. MIT S9508]KZR88437.1 hypothetical protein MITS9508_02262 [Synechococcus sp. MIT S9508]
MLRRIPIIAAGAVLLGATATVAEQVTLTLSNGDTLHGELIPSASTDTTTVLQHPVLGRLSIPKTSLMPETKPKPWKLSLSGGVTGSNTDNDLDVGGTAQLETSYASGADKVSLKVNAQYEVSRDEGETSNSTDTNEGDAELRYIRSLNSRLHAYAGAHFNYDTLNLSGTDAFESSIGLGYDLIKTSKTRFTVSLGPSIEQIWGGDGCNADPVCGQTFAATTARAELEWKPSSATSLTLTNTYTGAYVNGISTNNIFSIALKVFPMKNQRLFTSLNGQTIYNELRSPKVNNNISIQVGVKLD